MIPEKNWGLGENRFLKTQIEATVSEWVSSAFECMLGFHSFLSHSCIRTLYDCDCNQTSWIYSNDDHVQIVFKRACDRAFLWHFEKHMFKRSCNWGSHIRLLTTLLLLCSNLIQPPFQLIFSWTWISEIFFCDK